MATRTEIENFRFRGDTNKDLNRLANLVGYKEDMCGSAFMNFLSDNPGAIEVIQEWVVENLAEEDDDCCCEEEDIDGE